jgi:hypothetical protein
MADAVRPRRINGLQSPRTTAQLSTWIFLPVLIIEFVLFVSPILPLVASILCTVLLCLLAMTASYFAFMAMTIDPADPRILVSSSHDSNDGAEGNNTDGTSISFGGTKTHNQQQQPQPQQQQICTANKHHNHHRRTWDRNEPTKHCWICDVQVGEKSMHCKFCNKCIDHFDHHCMCTYLLLFLFHSSHCVVSRGVSPTREKES